MNEIKTRQLIHGQFLHKVLVSVPRMILAFLIHLLPWLSSDNGPTPSLFKQEQVTKGYHSNHFRIGCNVSDCIFTSSSLKNICLKKKLNIIKYWRVNSILKDPHSGCGKPPEAGGTALRQADNNYLLAVGGQLLGHLSPTLVQSAHPQSRPFFLQN